MGGLEISGITDTCFICPFFLIKIDGIFFFIVFLISVTQPVSQVFMQHTVTQHLNTSAGSVIDFQQKVNIPVRLL